MLGPVIFGQSLELQVGQICLRGGAVPDAFEVRAKLGDIWVGSIEFSYLAHLEVCAVFGIVVVEDHFGVSLRRRGVATALYTAAHRFSCERYGVPLASDTELMPGSRGFWLKQVAAGTARLDKRLGRFVFASCSASP